MAELKYTYALDETKTRLVHINDARQGEKYFCPNSKCDERLIIKDGGYKRKHFSHVKNGDKCSYDNYLHTLAEKRIVEWFNSINELLIETKIKDYCKDYKNCIWVNNGIGKGGCSKRNLRSLSLKNYYNKIEIEKRDRGFVWDLFMSNTNRPNLDPIAIEIFVTHKCEDKKLDSGVRIIEIKIENEEQLEKIVSSNKLSAGKNIIFYNFKFAPKETNTRGVQLYKFMLYENMKLFIDQYNMNCKSYQKRKNSTLFEFTFGNINNEEINELYSNVTDGLYSYSFGCAIAHKKFPQFKNCTLCSYYKYNDYYSRCICCLYKKLNLKDNHDPTQALTCNSFLINKNLIKECINKLNIIPYNIWIKGEDIDVKGRNFT